MSSFSEEVAFEAKFRAVLLRLQDSYGKEIEDDTVLPKLKLYVSKYLLRKDGESRYSYSERLGLTTYILYYLQKLNSEEYKKFPQVKNLASFGLKVVGNLVGDRQGFIATSKSKILQEFLKAMPFITSEASLTCEGLEVVQSLMHHEEGLDWIQKNGIWEKFLISALQSRSMFVQRLVIKVIVQLLTKVQPTQKCTDYLEDLLTLLFHSKEEEEILDEDGPLRRNYTTNDQISHLRNSSVNIVRVFEEYLYQALSSFFVYSQINSMDLPKRIIFLLDDDQPFNNKVLYCRITLLLTLHKFGEQTLLAAKPDSFQILNFDILNFIRFCIDIGNLEPFLKSSLSIYRYWGCLKRLLATKRLSESLDENTLIPILRLQFLPLHQAYMDKLFQSNQEISSEVAVLISDWDRTIKRRCYSNTNREEFQSMWENILSEKIEKKKDPRRAQHECISNIMDVVDEMQPPCAVLLFQCITFFLYCSARESFDNQKVEQNLVETQIKLVENLNIDWTSCTAPVHLTVLNDILAGPKRSSALKITILKAMNKYIKRLPDIVTGEGRNNKLFIEEPMDTLGSNLGFYLLDVEWEVRDSVLEFIHSCMSITNDTCVFFKDWFIRHKILEQVLGSLGDVNNYVQVSALLVLESISLFEDMWQKLLDKYDIKKHAQLCVLYSDEDNVRLGALKLISRAVEYGHFTVVERQDLFTAIERAFSDINEEVRLISVELVAGIVNADLADRGLVDRFPSESMSEVRLTNVGKEECVSVREVIRNYNNNGYLNILSLSLSDSFYEVRLKAARVICFINKLIGDYVLEPNKEALFFTRDVKVVTPEASVIASSEAISAKGCEDIQIVDEVLQEDKQTFNASTDEQDEEKSGNADKVELVLNTNDFEKIYDHERRLSMSTNLNWWDQEFVCQYRQPEKISISLAELPVLCERAEEEIRNSKELKYEDEEFLNLLDDILVETGSIQQQVDCY